MIGVLTAFIGDLASHFGCTIGLKDAITAISFVALGTSVPGNIMDQKKYTCTHKDMQIFLYQYVEYQNFVSFFFALKILLITDFRYT